jgi:hypothetical protein
MTTLTARIREIEVTLDAPPSPVIGDKWPSHWLGAEISPAVVRFVDTRFHPERTDDEVRKMFTEVRHISASPMPLRSIFLTLARSSAKVA